MEAALSKRGGWTAAAMVAPASIIVTIGIVLPIVILFRYSLNDFVPGKLMVDALTFKQYSCSSPIPISRRRSIARCGLLWS